ncbi:L-lactate dehydrogenase (cytochrome) [Atopomonas hussainii]|uniref:L-lactate dehydrogenase (Cytochrome) n=1 Tax=Atopomonas hussainii TaxID=1429083 RepID=A0A1H7QZ71_9GAMM|nr:L-lactate dehydrogenase [Atopomonas hussainii]SEL52955.1 L-lactate dehydrogenase (cytochrome) [Atopomonas hussainii]
MASLLRFAATPDDYRQLAKRRLPRFLFDYIDGGAGDELTLTANQRDFNQWRLRQRVLCDVSQRDTRCQLFGETLSLPVVLAPLGMAGLYARRGEVQAARAAKAVGVPFCLSSVGICGYTEVSQNSEKPCWFQLYMLRDRGLVSELLERVWAQGCRTLLFTIDLPVAGARHRDQRNGLLDQGLAGKFSKAWQLLQCPQWLYSVGLRGKPHHFANLHQHSGVPSDIHRFKQWLDEQFDPSVTWSDIAWLRQQWPGTLILKGLLDQQDVAPACDSGADALVISNHGGRQLDGAASSISQLPLISQAIDGRMPLLIDGGVRSGSDILKACALGATAILAGRPWAWALAAGGQAGVEQWLRRWQNELSLSMALCGIRELSQARDTLMPA